MGRLYDSLRRIWPAIALIGIVAAVSIFGANLSPIRQRETIQLLINVVLVVGFYVYAGNSGIVSFGHMSFMAIGAYMTAWVTIPVLQKHVLVPELPGIFASAHFATLPAALVAGGAALVFALIIVLPISRLAGLAASLAMFAVLVIVYQVALNWNAATLGNSGLVGIPTNTTIWSALVWAAAAIVVAFAYQRSNSGLRLRASREDEFAARAAGITIARDRAIAFVLSAFIIGIGGFLYAQYLGTVTPSAFFVQITFLTIAMLVVGGRNSLAGAVLGAVIISIVSFFFNSVEESGLSLGPVGFDGRAGLSDTALAAFILLALVFRRSGLMRGREIELPRIGDGARPIAPRYVVKWIVTGGTNRWTRRS